MRTALGEAVRRRQVAQTVPALARPPRVEHEEVEPYTIEEVRLILQAAGLHWPDVDLEAGIIRIRTSRLRHEYEHGCKVPCGKKAGWCPRGRRSPTTTTAQSPKLAAAGSACRRRSSNC